MTGSASVWRRWSLARQFAVAGGAVMLVAVLAVGLWVSRWIEEVVVRNSANATALYVESFMAPLMQDLVARERLSPDARLEIDRLLQETALGERVVSFKLWRKGGLLVDASNAALVGQRFEPTENLRLAWAGEVRADFDDTGDTEDVAEAALGVPLLEIYSPIREIGTGEVIAVAEFYEVATDLQADLAQARLASFAAVAAVMGGIGAALFAIVLRGSRTIERQMEELADLSDRNRDLRMRAQAAAGRVAALNDRVMKGVGADLHDGPAQLLGFAALRLDALRGELAPGTAAARDLDQVERAVQDAMAELRQIAKGLSLPDVEARPLPALLRALAEGHRARTGAAVEVTVEGEAADQPVEAKVCAYRVAQEGLTNGWRHGGGAGQALHLRLAPGRLDLAVRDRGPGFGADPMAGPGMGLQGLRDRVESLGGRLELRGRDGGGAELVMGLETEGHNG